MTQKERMLAGLTYDSRDPELLDRYHLVRGLLSRYREVDSRDSKQKRSILEILLGDIGQEVWIEAPFFCDYGEHISIGNNVFINYNCIFLDSNKITIGDNVLIGPGVHIYCASHPIKAADRICRDPDGGRQTYYRTQSKPVSIASNTWIGGGVKIMPGVTVGENTTIGAGSVVTQSIPADRFAAGNPCKIIRELE